MTDTRLTSILADCTFAELQAAHKRLDHKSDARRLASWTDYVVAWRMLQSIRASVNASAYRDAPQASVGALPSASTVRKAEALKSYSPRLMSEGSADWTVLANV